MSHQYNFDANGICVTGGCGEMSQPAPSADGRRDIQMLVDALVELGTLCSLAEVEKNNCASCRILHGRIPWLRELVLAAPAPVSGEGRENNSNNS